MSCFILCKDFVFLLLILNISRTGEQGDVIADMDSIVFWAEKIVQKEKYIPPPSSSSSSSSSFKRRLVPKSGLPNSWMSLASHTFSPHSCDVTPYSALSPLAVQLVFDPSTHSPSPHTLGGLGKEATRRASRAKKEITAWREMAASITYPYLSP